MRLSTWTRPLVSLCVLAALAIWLEPAEIVSRLSRLEPDLTIIPCHDFDLWPQLRQAPDYYA